MKNRFALVFTIVLVVLMGLPIAASLVRQNREVSADIEDSAGEDLSGDGSLINEDNLSENRPPINPEEPLEKDLSGNRPPVKAPLEKYKLLLEVNPYVVGWLSIDGSTIDDPVVYTPGSQNYFLHRALDGKQSEKGTFFIAVDWEEGYNNTLIYGHNMKDGSGFGALPAFADEQYGLSHSKIRFDTLYEDREYDLLAVFYSHIEEEELETDGDRTDRDRMIAEKSLAKLKEEGIEMSEAELTVKDLDLTRDFGGVDIYRQEKDEDNGRFRYYYYTDLSDRNDFDYYVSNVMERRLYDTGVTAEWGDDLLTLSTCSYHVKNGRLIVVGVRKKAP